MNLERKSEALHVHIIKLSERKKEKGGGTLCVVGIFTQLLNSTKGIVNGSIKNTGPTHE